MPTRPEKLPAEFPVPLLRSEPGGVLSYANEAAKAFFGTEIVGKHVSALYAGDDVEAIASARSTYQSLRSSPSGVLHAVSVQVRRSDGARRRVAASFYLDAKTRSVTAVIFERPGALLSAISRIMESLLQRSSADDALSAIAEEAAGLADADRGYVELYDPADGALVMKALFPGPRDFIGHRFPSEQGIAGWVFRSQETYLSNDVETDKHFYPLFGDTRSKIVVPLLVKLSPALPAQSGHCLGILGVDSRNRNAFWQDHAGVLEALADYAALALMFSEDLSREMSDVADAYSRLAASIRDAFDRLAAPRYLHEAKNTLQNVADMMEDVAEELGERKFSGKLVREFQQLQDAVQDMALVLRDELERIKQQRSVIDPAELDLMSVIKRARNVAGLSDRKITIDLEPPKTNSHAFVTYDAMLIILLNLLNNSVSAIRSSGSGNRITIRVVEHPSEERMVRIEIEDNGPGMKRPTFKALASRLRDGQFRPGVGLGLLQVKQLVDDHGGAFAIQSTLGQGTKALIDLPRHRKAR